MTSALFQAYLDIDKALVAQGVYKTSDVWLQEIERFYKHPTARVMVECMGRGSSKSTNSCKMALAEVLAGDWAIPPGEVHYFAHVAENVTEANKTVGILEKYLGYLGMNYHRSKGTIKLTELPIGFMVMACRIGAVSGFRCIGWTTDEVAKYNNDGTDPSDEIVSSVKAMTVTHPRARGRIISSPLGTKGFFYDIWKRGNTDDQIAGQFPSWVANPSVSEADTRGLEKNIDKWRREYAAVPIEGGVESLFSAEVLRRAVRPKGLKVKRVERQTPTIDNYAIKHTWVLPPEPGVQYFAGMDPGLTRNAWTMVVAGRRMCTDGQIRRSVVFAKEWRASRDNPLDPFIVLKEIAQILAEYDLSSIDSDEHHAASLKAIAGRDEIGLHVNVITSTARGNLEGYEGLYTLLSEGSIELPDCDELREDLLGVRRVVISSGLTIKLDTIGDRHSDYAPSVLKAMSKTLPEPEAQGPEIGSPAYYKLQEQVAEAALISKLERQKMEEKSGDWFNAEARAAGFNI